MSWLLKLETWNFEDMSVWVRKGVLRKDFKKFWFSRVKTGFLWHSCFWDFLNREIRYRLQNCSRTYKYLKTDFCIFRPYVRHKLRRLDSDLNFKLQNINIAPQVKCWILKCIILSSWNLTIKADSVIYCWVWNVL